MITEAQKVYNRRYYLKHKKLCHARAKAWRQKNRGYLLLFKRNFYNANKEKLTAENRQRKQLIKMQVFEHYGKECNCCGEVHVEFLCIDHLNGGGNKHRKVIGTRGGTEFYAWLKRNGFPKGFRTLCLNCNMAIGMFGKCPHIIISLSKNA